MDIGSRVVARIQERFINMRKQRYNPVYTLFFLAIVSCHFSTAAFSQDQENNTGLYNSIKSQSESEKQGEDKTKYSEKLKYLEGRVKYHQEDWSLRYELAKQYEEEGYFLKSIDQYEKVVVGLPKFVDAYVRLGLLYSFVGRYKDGERLLSGALEIDENNAVAMSGLAQLYYFSPIYRESIDFMKVKSLIARALEIDPYNIFIRINYATIMEEECYLSEGMVCNEAMKLWQGVHEKSSSLEMKGYARTRVSILKSRIHKDSPSQ